MDFPFYLVYCTCPDIRVAEAIATTAVNQQVAACVNIIPGVQSIYSWEGKIESSKEYLLIIKTNQNCYSELENIILAKHPYDCPEIIAMPIEKGSQGYLSWLASSLKL